MSDSTPIAVVTGGNKGIGFAIVKGLCRRFPGIVYLTARNEERGNAAVKLLERTGLHPKFHQLDIDDAESIANFAAFIKKEHGGIDVLVNNAAIAFKNNAKEPFSLQASETLRVNYTDLVNVCDALFPLLRPGARVIHLSSSCGHLSQISTQHIRERFGDPYLTVEGLNQIVADFVESAAKGTNADDGWGNSAYVISKVAVSALTFIQDRLYKDRGYFINCVHPGYVDTDMTSHRGILTIEQGAEAPLFLALDATPDVHGCYVWRDSTIVDWYGVMPDMY